MSVQEPGICPMCGQTDLEYGLGTPHAETYVYDCFCPACEFVGQEVYNLEFAGPTDNNDSTEAFIE